VNGKTTFGIPIWQRESPACTADFHQRYFSMRACYTGEYKERL